MKHALIPGFGWILAGGLTVGGGQAWPEGATPEASGGPIEEVMVTARKREERLQDIPGSAAALSEALIDDIGGIDGLRELMDQIVGITITEAQSADLTEPSIRGAGQSRNRMSVSATGIYRNGAYFASNGLGGRSFARMDTYDVARVEVLRGPQGALYGRNALGGAINIISKRPEDEFGVSVRFGGGEKERMLLEGIVNAPITDALAARISYFTDERDDGFFKNQDGDAVDTLDYDHLRVGLRWNVSDDLTAYYAYDNSEDEFAPGIRIRRSHLAARGVDEFDTLINTPHEVNHEIDNHALMLDWDLARGAVSAVTNYRKRDLVNVEDVDHFVVNLAQASNLMLSRQTTNDTDVLFQELRYVSALGGPVEFLVGADYYSVNAREDLDDFVTGSQTIPSISAIRFIDIDQDSWAIYGSTDYRFENIPVSLSGEIRYAVDEVDGGVQLFRPLLGPDPETDFADHERFTNVPWTVTASWHFGDAQMYGKVASAYRHGGLNLNAGLPTDAFPVSLTYDEETSRTYEVGYKSTWWGNRLTFNAAAFFTRYEDFLDTTTNGCPESCTLFDPVTNQALGFDANGNRVETNPGGEPGVESPRAFFIDNVGEVELWGVELELAARVPVEMTGGRLFTNVGWSHQEGEVTDISDDVSPASAGLDGAKLNQVRPVQLKGNVIYRQPLPFASGGVFAGAELLLALTYAHEHGGFRNLAVDADRLDGVDRLDVRFGIDATHWSLMLNGTNVLDKDYDLFTANGGDQFRRNEPEYYWAELTWRLR